MSGNNNARYSNTYDFQGRSTKDVEVLLNFSPEVVKLPNSDKDYFKVNVAVNQLGKNPEELQVNTELNNNPFLDKNNPTPEGKNLPRNPTVLFSREEMNQIWEKSGGNSANYTQTNPKTNEPYLNKEGNPVEKVVIACKANVVLQPRTKLLEKGDTGKNPDGSFKDNVWTFTDKDGVEQPHKTKSGRVKTVVLNPATANEKGEARTFSNNRIIASTVSPSEYKASPELWAENAATKQTAWDLRKQAQAEAPQQQAPQAAQAQAPAPQQSPWDKGFNTSQPSQGQPAPQAQNEGPDVMPF